VDAEPLLSEVARQLEASHLDAVLIGNAAAALQGAPVTTVDVDFMFRKTPRNVTARAESRSAVRPFGRVSRRRHPKQAGGQASSRSRCTPHIGGLVAHKNQAAEPSSPFSHEKVSASIQIG
jgi:hypothetical protein